jgi:hypothetical protein
VYKLSTRISSARPIRSRLAVVKRPLSESPWPAARRTTRSAVRWHEDGAIANAGPQAGDARAAAGVEANDDVVDATKALTRRTEDIAPHKLSEQRWWIRVPGRWSLV